MAENDLFNELPKIDSRCDIKRPAFNPFSLDAINFLLADVRGALGPYLNVSLPKVPSQRCRGSAPR